MKICRFGAGRVGLVDNGRVFDVTAQIPPDTVHPALWLQVQAGDTLLALRSSATSFALDDVALLSPVARPGKVVAAPINYRAHVDEMLSNGQAYGHIQTDIRKAGLFLKASSSVVGPSEGIAQRFADRRTDHEIELCAVIGRRADRVRANDALSHVAGWCLGLDITVRGPEDRSFRKSIDSYCVLGPWLTTADEGLNPDDLDLELRVDGETRQQANTSDMVLNVAELIEFASMFYTLEPGDVLMTGTPQGVGPIFPGAVLLASGTGLGTMRTLVRAAD
jgi:2-keto-4-pentenoate hydratase/2-oxohepta-3-ene-1,7-dioic acid hydratase in catechol pathway